MNLRVFSKHNHTTIIFPENKFLHLGRGAIGLSQDADPQFHVTGLSLLRSWFTKLFPVTFFSWRLFVKETRLSVERPHSGFCPVWSFTMFPCQPCFLKLAVMAAHGNYKWDWPSSPSLRKVFERIINQVMPPLTLFPEWVREAVSLGPGSELGNLTSNPRAHSVFHECGIFAFLRLVWFKCCFLAFLGNRTVMTWVASGGHSSCVWRRTGLGPTVTSH